MAGDLANSLYAWWNAPEITPLPLGETGFPKAPLAYKPPANLEGVLNPKLFSDKNIDRMNDAGWLAALTLRDAARPTPTPSMVPSPSRPGQMMPFPTGTELYARLLSGQKARTAPGGGIGASDLDRLLRVLRGG